MQREKHTDTDTDTQTHTHTPTHTHTDKHSCRSPPCEWKDVKNEFLHLDAVRFGGFYMISTFINERNLLECNVLLQFALVLPVE